ncbi:MAG: type II toxin-antitoxin system PemK/MazF family toxin [Alphaproteobacteria bacterium]|nr:type II toxin-antitoxin system PemK/MazF family toxin [Alphaproteobacteria bacterium]
MRHRRRGRTERQERQHRDLAGRQTARGVGRGLCQGHSRPRRSTLAAGRTVRVGQIGVALVKQPQRFQVYLVVLDPTQGSEIRKTRPCVVVSPDEANRHLNTVIVAPMTTVRRPYPTRIDLRFAGKDGQAALDQLRAIDKSRLVRRVGELREQAARRVSAGLVEMFQY